MKLKCEKINLSLLRFVPVVGTLLALPGSQAILDLEVEGFGSGQTAGAGRGRNRGQMRDVTPAGGAAASTRFGVAINWTGD